LESFHNNKTTVTRNCYRNDADPGQRLVSRITFCASSISRSLSNAVVVCSLLVLRQGRYTFTVTSHRTLRRGTCCTQSAPRTALLRNPSKRLLIICCSIAHVDQIHKLAWRPNWVAPWLELASCSEDGMLKVARVSGLREARI
jgi:hypothetical protein